MVLSSDDELLKGFLEEAADGLQGVPDLLARYQHNPSAIEAIHSVFRVVHTIKGNAAFFGLAAVKQFAHSFEDSLDKIRQSSLPVSDELGRLLVEANDALESMLGRASQGALEPSLTGGHEQLLGRIAELCSRADGGDPYVRLLREMASLADEIAAAGVQQSADWSSRLRRFAAAEANAAEGDCSPSVSHPAATATSASALASDSFAFAGHDVSVLVRRSLAAFLAADANRFQTADGQESLTALRELLSLAEKGQQTQATPIREAIAALETILGSGLSIDSHLLSLAWDTLAPALASWRASLDAPAAGAAEPKTAGSPRSETGGENGREKNRFLRVREESIDRFFNGVASLFITCERLKDLQSRMAAGAAASPLLEELRQVNVMLGDQTDRLQRAVVELRKVPARGLLARFPRVARELAASLGKQLDVHISGEDVAIDKSLVEDLDGPLMHMVRNVCDHGIETPAERMARGVSPSGNLWISCELTKELVVITVRDDGRGIDPSRLREKAVKKGVLSSERAAAMNDEEAVELIFHPGFSTAEQLSEVSGRGVGLDVVRSRLLEHNGDVKVQSVVGEGTTFRLEIPIRRAVVVVDALLLRHNSDVFVLPIEHIHEIVRIQPHDLTTVHGRPLAVVRGQPYAAMALHDLLGASAAVGALQVGVLVKTKSSAVCLLVEQIVGQRKVVINDISTLLPCPSTISGVAPLGGGSLALVLNGKELADGLSSNRTAMFAALDQRAEYA